MIFLLETNVQMVAHCTKIAYKEVDLPVQPGIGMMISFVQCELDVTFIDIKINPTNNSIVQVVVHVQDSRLKIYQEGGEDAKDIAKHCHDHLVNSLGFSER